MGFTGAGEIGGAAVGGLFSLFGKKNKGPKMGPHYKAAQDILYGQALGALNNWGSPVVQQYLQTDPKAAEEYAKLFGGDYLEDQDLQRKFKKEGLLGIKGPYNQNQLDMYRDAARKALGRMGRPDVRFGYGGGNLGGYSGGYGGPLGQQ